MSYRQCLSNGIKEGIIKDELGKKQLKLLEKFEKRYLAQGMPEDQATRLAAQDAYDFLKAEKNLLLQRRLQAAKAQKRIDQDLEAPTNTHNDKVNYYDNINRMLDYNNQFGVLNVTNLSKTFRSKFYQPIADLLIEQRSGFRGRNKDQKIQMMQVVREYMNPGTSSDKTIKAFAKALTDSFETARKTLNELGAGIGKIDYAWLPQLHDIDAIGKVSAREWIDFILPKLDLNKMIDNNTGKPFLREDLIPALQTIYNDIVSGGIYSKIPKAGFKGSKSLANKRIDHRFLHFKNSISYLDYMNKFGEGDIFHAVINHLDSMSRDAALMYRFGPNPTLGLEYAFTKARQLQVKNEGIKSVADQTKMLIAREMFDHHKGTFYAQSSGLTAKFFAGIRGFATSAVLGAATLLAQTDFIFSGYTSRFNGMPALRASKKSLEIFTKGLKGNADQLKVALRNQVITEFAAQTGATIQRFQMEYAMPKVAQMLADFTLRFSGLSHLTQAGRTAFQMEFYGWMADQVLKKKSFKELPDKFQQSLKRYDIQEFDWEMLKKIKLYDAAIHDENIRPGSAMFLRPHDIFEVVDSFGNKINRDDAFQLYAKVQNMILTETEHAIPSASLKGKTVASVGLRPGTIPGELGLSALMFKQFPITIMMTHIARGMGQKTYMGKVGYLLPLIALTTIGATIAHEQREFFKGRKFTDFSKMDSDQLKRYFFARMIQGGGFGILGDFVYSETNSQYNTGIEQLLAGPVVNLAVDLFEVGEEGVKIAMGEDDTKLGKEFSDILKKWTPGNSIFFIRLAFERMLVDHLQELLDPDIHKSRRRTIRRFLKNENREYWWSPGETFPEDQPGISR